jgi:hypothetical protein
MAMLGLSAVIGVLLGFYCRVLAVIPALIVVLFATAALDAGAPLLSIFVHVMLVCIALEFCYLAGALWLGVIRHLARSAADADGGGAVHSNRRDGPFVLSN